MDLWTLSPALRAQLFTLSLLTLAEASVPNPTASTLSTPSSTFTTLIGIGGSASTPGFSSSSASNGAMPSATDNAPGGQNDPGQQPPSSLANYYFVFFALVFCLAGLGLFFVWHRKRKAHLAYQASGEGTPNRNQAASEQRRQMRRYLGRWRSAETSREEGLNEQGEAPPPYVPKTAEEERLERTGGSAIAVPLQTLSREHAGFKPPDYAEANEPPVSESARRSNVSGEGSSHDHDHHPGDDRPRQDRTDP